jgi:LysR family glycine cleavage system transcriptional activator
LNSDYPDWQRYLNELGIERENVLQGSSFNQAAIAIDAARDGLGVLLGRTLLTESYLENGDLVAISDSYPESTTYFVRRDQSAKHQQEIDQVCDWLRQEARAST